jgi:hypothetical protein
VLDRPTACQGMAWPGRGRSRDLHSWNRFSYHELDRLTWNSLAVNQASFPAGSCLSALLIIASK